MDLILTSSNVTLLKSDIPMGQVPGTSTPSHDDSVSTAPVLDPQSTRGWLGRLWASIAERGRSFAAIPSNTIDPVERARLLAVSLVSERGEASGAAIARELLNVLDVLDHDQHRTFFDFLAEGFQPEHKSLAEAARVYLAHPSPETAAALTDCAEPPRQELLRRMNMAQGGTAALVTMRKELLVLIPTRPSLKPLDADLRHLLSSWFNRGFLELRRIDWQTPAATLEKLIAYEAVHEIQGWDDLRRRLAPDRRCFAFFHPALSGEPLIFVEVALVKGLANSVQGLLEREIDDAAQRARANEADTAIFYSISNCQDGLRGISFGNFLIKQVVEELRAELPGLSQFATLSPAPGFRRWLEARMETGDLPDIPLGPDERQTLFDAAGMPLGPVCTGAVLRVVLGNDSWSQMEDLGKALRPALLHLCALYLTRDAKGVGPIDPVARFHLGNGAQLEQINWMSNSTERGLRESYGIMVNYLYDPALIEANHERFTRDGVVAKSPAVDALISTVQMVPDTSPLLLRLGRRAHALIPRLGRSTRDKDK